MLIYSKTYSLLMPGMHVICIFTNNQNTHTYKMKKSLKNKVKKLQRCYGDCRVYTRGSLKPCELICSFSLAGVSPVK